VLEFAFLKGKRELSYRLFRDKADARAFEQSLDFSLLDTTGSPIDFDVTVLHASGFVGFEDFLELIRQYNQN
jgi:uncharacterized protein YccT (UPF0319 family)